MARKSRIEYQGAAYHVMSRSNRGADIFVEGSERLLFLNTFDEVCGRMAWLLQLQTSVSSGCGSKHL